MYYLYIDESGDDGDYDDLDVKGGSSPYFTLGGIIVDEDGREKFYDARKSIISTYFSDTQLPSDFVLHYFDLREARPPFHKMSKAERFAFSNDVFKALIYLPCSFLSITIDLKAHCKKYRRPVNVRAYSLILMLERFQYFLENKNKTGEAIYEEFNSVLQKKSEVAHKWLLTKESFPAPTNFNRIISPVQRGDPTKEQMLEFADFFAYAPYVMRTSNGQKKDRWNSIKHKYFNPNGAWLKKGFVEI